MSRIALKTFAADPLEFFAVAFKTRGLAMAPFQNERFKMLAPGLIALARAEKPPHAAAWWEGTKGSSKDSDLALAILWLLAFTSTPIDGQIGAADSDQADELRKAARTWLQSLPWLASRVRIERTKIVCDGTSSEVSIVPADAAGGAHGSRCLLYIINEISHIGRTEFWQTQLDNAAKVPNGLVIVATNAGFVGSEAWSLREMARTSPRWAFHQFTRPAPWLDAAAVEERRRSSTPSRYSRLYEGVWANGLGDALEDSDIEAAIDRSIGPMPAALPGVGFVAGLDLGIKSDHSALTIIGKQIPNGYTNSQAFYRLANLETWSPSPATGKVSLEEVEAAVLAAHQRFDLQAVAFDPWQAMHMAERLSKAGVRMIEVPFTGKNLDVLARNLLEVFRNRVFTMYDSPRLISDLRKLSIVEKSYGYRLEATRDQSGHADAATALVLALLAARDHCSNASFQPWGGVIYSREQMQNPNSPAFQAMGDHFTHLFRPAINMPHF